MGAIFNSLLAAWAVLGAMGPYLLIGFLVAGLLSVAFSPQWVERHLGRESFGSVVKAALMGVPLPLCSCGVLPVSASMRRHGAGKAAAVSFLISTPQTGIDSIAATYAVLGPLMAVYRPIVALLSGMLGGFLAYRLAGPNVSTAGASANGDDAEGGASLRRSGMPAEGDLREAEELETASADAARHREDCCEEAVRKVRRGDCCEGSAGELGGACGAAARGYEAVSPRWRRALSYGLLELPRDIGATLLAGALIAGAVSAFVEPSALASVLGGGPIAMLLVVLASVPIYVCATGSVPIAAGLIHMGASPGVAFAFLVAGPASNAASLTVVGSLLGRRMMLIYLATVAGSVVGGGLLLDQLVRIWPVSWSDAVACLHHEEGISVATHLWASVVLVVIGSAYLYSRLKKTESVPQAAGRWRWRIEGMRCGQCETAVKRSVGELPGVQSVDVSREQHTLLVRGCGVEPEDVESAVRQLGYSLERSPSAPSAECDGGSCG